MSARTVLLVSPPWSSPQRSSLALATLAGVLAGAGLEAEELHGSLLFPRPQENPWPLFELTAPFCFAPHLQTAADVERTVDAMLDHCSQVLCLDGIAGTAKDALLSVASGDTQRLRRDAREHIKLAGICIDRCVAAIDADRYAVVGFSVSFDRQLPAALAIARHIKARCPTVPVIFGGPACFGDQAQGLVSAFPEIDAVCHCEGEQVVVPLVRTLLAGGDLSVVPGVAHRLPGGGTGVQAAPEPLSDLDALPVPCYDTFLQALAGSEWADQSPVLLFETSRGCWWGQHHPCTFCGLNAQTRAFRRKTSRRALREIRMLHEQYPTAALLEATDNILDRSYLRTVLPRLVEMQRQTGRPLRLFWEVRTGLRREEVRLLAEAGIVSVQPGIESFSDGVLELMGKGVTGVEQIQFLKWAWEQGIEVGYNLLISTPGEQVGWYRDLVLLIPFLRHLPPPTFVSTVQLERFSRYHRNPEAFRIRNVRPSRFYRQLFGEEIPGLEQIASVFDFDHETRHDPQLRRAHREFLVAVEEWLESWKPWLLYWREGGSGDREGITVVDRRSGEPQHQTVHGTSLRLFRLLDRARTLPDLQDALPELGRRRIEEQLRGWLRSRWIVKDGAGRYLNVIPRRATANPE